MWDEVLVGRQQNVEDLGWWAGTKMLRVWIGGLMGRSSFINIFQSC
jgi:hypothetical protein